MGVGPLLVLSLIVVVGAVLFGLVSLTKKGRKLNVDKYRVRWMEIEQSVQKDSQGSYMIAVLNADKLVDQALRDLGTRGNTMGERMKVSKDKFSHLNALWDAHKLRNRIAHEDGVKLSHMQTRRALAAFKRALKDLGAI